MNAGKLSDRKRFWTILAGALLVWLVIFSWRLYRELNPAPWENEIAAFERRDLTNRAPDEAVLFVGSSSVALWETLRNDLPRFRVFRRGFGGAHMSDVVTYAGRIILPYEPLMVVVHAGGNDLAAGKSPGQVLKDFKALVRRIHRVNPQLRIGFISIKPSPARWHLVQAIRQANRMIKAYTEQDERLVFIDIFDQMLDGSGQPRQSLYASDGLHLNREGYRLWADSVRPYLPPEARRRMNELVNVATNAPPGSLPVASSNGAVNSRAVFRP